MTGDAFDTSVGKVKAILLRVSPVVQLEKKKKTQPPSRSNRRCLNTNMPALIEGSGRSTSVVTGRIHFREKSREQHRVINYIRA